MRIFLFISINRTIHLIFGCSVDIYHQDHLDEGPLRVGSASEVLPVIHSGVTVRATTMCFCPCPRRMWMPTRIRITLDN
ncbi:hypothetical protein JTE90_004639 [Oedothorax gibbosus]|uniref:Secreted protein n=1 Tax=Oedothorax gibbosus TaxID=931172 RepID=A0AAV6TMA4_9ARAC|nr:hypothetical protein JTE90_004639 [Oedothorax gibbosus]